MRLLDDPEFTLGFHNFVVAFAYAHCCASVPADGATNNTERGLMVHPRLYIHPPNERQREPSR